MTKVQLLAEIIKQKIKHNSLKQWNKLKSPKININGNWHRHSVAESTNMRSIKLTRRIDDGQRVIKRAHWSLIF